MTTRLDPAALAAWTAYQAANERARQDYDLATARDGARATGACHGCDQPVHGSALYCQECRLERRRADYRAWTAHRRRKGGAA